MALRNLTHSVVDPNQHHLDTDPDLAGHFDADPDPAFHFDADPYPDATLSLSCGSAS